jgi:hypothetical protein
MDRLRYRVTITRKAWQLGFVRLSQYTVFGWNDTPCQMVGNRYNGDCTIDCTSDIVGIKCGNWIRRRVASGTQEMILGEAGSRE